MATIKHNLSVEDPTGSIKKRTSDAKELGQQLDNVATKAKKASAAQAAGAAAARQNMEYGRGRGAMGATGASARDFANEAQGLGGLVRLYATYAANVFAVSAAFRALSNAMDTTNMIRGLDQLGASSGVAMGSLAKRFADVSGGAISLRESMEATAKSMSSGMTQQQFLQLGEVAKKASQALGIAMPDAVSRLTRGITKLEPELLDELGLFTKVGKATEDYARKVGKSVDSLSDFERRQAFANAVLAEGVQKFSDIDIPTNPYDKLLATLKNVTQGMLEVVNKGLVPLVDFLSRSPGALTAVIAGLGIMILRQALPIFTSYRAAMQKATEEVAKLAAAKQAQAQRALDITRKAKAAELKVELDHIAQVKAEQVDAAEAALRKVSTRGLSKQVQGVLAKPDILSITDKDLAILDRLGEKQTKVAVQYRALATAIREAQRANEQYNVGVAAAEAKAGAPAAFGSAAYAAQQRLESARRQAAGAALTSRVGETVATAGTLAASKELLSGLKTEKLGLFRGGLTAISGAATIAAGTLSNLGAVFSKFLGWIGIAVTVFEMLDFAFSKNGKEMSKFNDALSLGEENAKAAALTYEKYNEKLTTQNIIASAQAITNLSDSMKGLVDALEQADRKASGWDRFVDGFKTLWGGDLKSKFGESLALQVEAGISSISDPALKERAREQLELIFNTKDITAEGIKQAAEAIKPENIISAGRQTSELFKQISTQAGETAAKLRSVDEGFKTLDTSYQNLANSLIQKDPLTDFAQNLIQQGFKLKEVFNEPIAAAAQLRAILSDTSKLKLLAPNAQAELIRNKEAIQAVIDEIAIMESRVATSNARIKEYKTSKGKANYDIEAEKSNLASNQAGLQDAAKRLADLTGTLGKAAIESVKKGFDLLTVGFEKAIKEGILTQQKSLLDKLPKTAATIKLGAELENKKIDLQINQIKQTERLIKEMELSRLSAERIAIETKRDTDLREESNPLARDAIRQDAERKLKPIAQREAVVKSTNIAADIESGKIEKTEESRLALLTQQGSLQKIRELANQKELNDINAQVDTVSAWYEKEGQFIDRRLARLAAERQEYESNSTFRELSLEQQQAALNLLDGEQRALELQKATLTQNRDIEVAKKIEILATQKGWTQIVEAAKEAGTEAKKNLSSAEGTTKLTQLAAKNEKDRANEIAIAAREYAKMNIELERQNALRAISDQLAMDMLNLDKNRLDQQLAESKITEDRYNQEVRALELLQLAKERDTKLTALQGDYLVKVTSLMEEYQRSDATGKALVQAKIVSASQAYEAQVDSINKVSAATIKLKEEQENLTTRQKGYDEIFKNSFNSMADALIEFTQTGKFNFKDMVNSMLQDIIRLEMRMQFQQMYMGMRSGFLSMFAADGAAFDTGGVQKFARGGAFTNQIVNEPVLFKFAQGTGMMGEAGPEAIMPLTRDSQGNLGVRNSSGGSAKVDVVINNYSGQQVEQQETIDSRGNRRVEVTIGDINAGEMSRSGSASQRAVTTTFGIPPMLIRR